MSNIKRSTKTEILKILNESERIPTGGLLIEGEWGAGKTFFWDKEVEPSITCEKIPRISIAGLSSTEAIYKALITAKYIHSIENLKVKAWWQSLKEIGSLRLKLIWDWIALKKTFLFEVLRKAGLDHSQFNLVKTLFRSIPWSELIPRNSVICLDDIERKSLPSIELLGLIIYLSEVKNCKVILIANSDYLDQEFKDHQEKMIWRSFRPVPDIDLIFDSFVEKYSSKSIVEKVKERKEDIIAPFKRGDKNLRVLARCIQDVDSILSFVGDEVLSKYIRFFCSLKIWKTEKGELNVRETYSAVSWYSLSLNNNSRELTPIEEEGRAFREKFWDSNEEVAESDSLYDFAKTGVLDADKMRSEIGPPGEVSDARKLTNELREQNWFFMSDVQISEICTKAEKIISDYNGDDPKLILYITRDCFRMNAHIGNQFPASLEKIISEKLLQLASKGFILEDLNEIDVRTEEESTFLNSFVSQYKGKLDQALIEKIAESVVAKLLLGKEFNSFTDIDNKYHFSTVVAEALSSKKVLSCLEEIESKFPEVYYSFFFRAIKKIREIPNIDSNSYVQKLGEVIGKMEAKDKSAQKRKTYLESLARPIIRGDESAT